MLAVAGTIVVVDMLKSPSDAFPKVSQLPRPERPLFKPEPQTLLDGKVELTAEQKTKLKVIATAWSTEKHRLNEAMAQYKPTQGRLDQISGSLQDYSSLSRQFDALRAHYWRVAVDVLTPDQRKEVQP